MNMQSSISNPFVVIMIILMLILALIIGLLANLVLGAAQLQLEKETKEKKPEEKKTVSSAASTAAALLLLLFSPSLFAQDKQLEAAAAATSLISGVSPTAFYVMMGVIFLELLVVAVLLYNLKLLLNLQRKKEAAATALETKPRISWWDKFNKFKPIEQEVALDLGHSYDGIRELDNRLPPWWLYGFYCTILFACIYLWRYHVAHSAPLSAEEFRIAMEKAAVQREAYLKKAANNVDETNVKLLTSQTDLAAGKNIFETTCFACHGKMGEGGVGPNLTDDYWLHGGDIKDVFKTIKYGWPEKGMKSWKDDYSPSQIAQIASYIKSLHGTHPANGKAPQGTPYMESDSSGMHQDSVKKLALK